MPSRSDREEGDRPEETSVVPSPVLNQSGEENAVPSGEVVSLLTIQAATITIAEFDVEPDSDREDSAPYNIFVSRSLPVPLESTYAQADITVVLHQTAVNTSAAPSLFD